MMRSVFRILLPFFFSYIGIFILQVYEKKETFNAIDYLFYNKDNDRISKNIPYELVYN